MPDPIAFPLPAERQEAAAAVRPAKTEVPAEPPARQARAKAEPSVAISRQPPTRLMIEEGSAGVFVYTVLDSQSGLVLARIPRDEVARLSEKQDYSAGAVVDAQA